MFPPPPTSRNAVEVSVQVAEAERAVVSGGREGARHHDVVAKRSVGQPGALTEEREGWRGEVVSAFRV